MKIQTFFLGLCLCFTLPLCAQSDAAGCEDPPLLKRYPAAVLKWCEITTFGTYHIAIGPQTGYRHIEDWVSVEGKIERFYYEVADGSTLSELYRNYRNSLSAAGFELLAQGLHPKPNVLKSVGGTSWMGTAYARNPYPPNSGVLLLQGSATSEGKGYLAARLDRPTGNVYVVVGAAQYSTDRVVVLVDLIEEAPMNVKNLKIDTDYLAREIELYGTATLHGLFFEFDKAELTPESRQTLQVLADYLTQHPDEKFFVVGHTDMKGTLTYNLTLSEARARAVVEALVKDYAIARSRLEGHGVGPLTPKATNENEQGRQLNRRVELVLRR